MAAEALRAQLLELGYDDELAHAAAQNTTDINDAVDWCEEVEEQRDRDDCVEHLQELQIYPEPWIQESIKIRDPTPERCVHWIELNRGTLEVSFPSQEVLRQQRRRLATRSVRNRPVIHRTTSEETGYSASILKDDDIKAGAPRFRLSVTGRDLTPLKSARGYLKKKGKSGTYTWRYFVLNNEYFNYYNSSSAFQHRKSPIGSYSLLTVERIEQNGKQFAIYFKQSARRGHSKRFQRKKFKAKTEENAREWLNALESRRQWFDGLRNADESSLAFRELVKYSLPASTNLVVPVHAASPHVTVDGPIIYKNSDGWDNGTVFLGPIVPASSSRPVHRWTIRLQVGNMTTVGICGIFADVNKLLTRGNAGWGVYLNNGCKGHNGECKEAYTKPVHKTGVAEYRADGGVVWSGGSTVTVQLDVANGTFGIFVNNEWRGVAFTGLTNAAQGFVCAVSLCRQGDCVSVERCPAPGLADLDGGAAAPAMSEEWRRRPSTAEAVPAATADADDIVSPFVSNAAEAQPIDASQPQAPRIGRRQPSLPRSASDIPVRTRSQPQRPRRSISEGSGGSAAEAGLSLFAATLDSSDNSVDAVLASLVGKKGPAPVPPIATADPSLPAVYSARRKCFAFSDMSCQSAEGCLKAGRYVVVSSIHGSGDEAVASLVAVLKDNQIMPVNSWIPLRQIQHEPHIEVPHQVFELSVAEASASPAVPVVEAEPVQIATSDAEPLVSAFVDAASVESEDDQSLAQVMISRRTARPVSKAVASLSNAKLAARASAARKIAERRIPADRYASPAPGTGGHLLMLRRKEMPDVPGGGVNVESDDDEDGHETSESSDVGFTPSAGGARKHSRPDDLEVAVQNGLYADEDAVENSLTNQGEGPSEWSNGLKPVGKHAGLVRTTSGRYVRAPREASQNEGHIFWDQIKKRTARRKARRERRRIMKAARRRP